jgi:hypothetical protein
LPAGPLSCRDLSASLHDAACPELITSVLRPSGAMETAYGWQSAS